MNLLEVYDLQYRKLGILNDNTVGSAKNIEESHNTNQISEVTFEMPLTSDKWQYVANENLIRWKNEYYFIKNPNFEHSKDKKKVKVRCSHLSSSLESNTVVEVKAIAWSATVLAKLALGYKALFDGDGDFTGFFDEAVPPSTGWRIGSVNLSKPNTLRSLEVKEQSAFTTLVKVAELFYATLNFNSVTKTVDISDIPINRNIQIRVGKNLKSVNVSYDTTELITRLYPFGGSDKDIGEISILGAIDKNGNEVTKSYIEDYSYYLAKDPTLTMDYINAHPELFLRELTWREGITTDPQMLYDEAIQKMEVISKPIVKCNVEGVDLSIFPEFFTQTPLLNEIITVIDEDLGLSFTTQVIAINKNNDNPLAMRVQTSNEVEYESIVKTLVNASSKVARTLTPIGEVKSEFLQGVINLMKVKLGSMQSNYTGVCSDEKGNLLIENTDKTKAMRIGGGGFSIASQRLADGTDYDWQTFGDGDGFVATLITAGVLVGGKIQFDLDQGTFLIGNSATDYLMYFDGTTLKLGGGVAIAWTQVTNADDKAVQAYENTYIDANGIYTGNVYANNISGNQIVGKKLRTVPLSQTASYIDIQESYIDFYNANGDKVFTIGTNFPESQDGKPQLFFSDGCSIDTYQGSVRLRVSATNYIRVNAGGGVDYINGSSTVSLSSPTVTVVPVFG